MTSATDAEPAAPPHEGAHDRRVVVVRLCAAFGALGPLLYLMIRQFAELGNRAIPCCDYAALDLGTSSFVRGEQFTGLYSRQGWRHPGPAPFLWNAPFRLVLGDSFATARIAMVALAIVAIGLVLWVAHRRLPTRAYLAATVVLMFWLVRFDVRFLAEPWNPDMAMLWVLATFASAWMAIERTTSRWSVATVIAASMAVQCHLSAAPIVVLALVPVIIATWRRRDEHTHRAVATAVGAGIVVWALPLWDLAFGEGNLWHILTVDESGWTGGFDWSGLGVDLVRIVGLGPARQGFAFGPASPFLESHSLDLATILVAAVVVTLLVRLALRRHHHPVLAMIAASAGAGLVLTAASLAASGGEYWPYVLMPAVGLGPIMALCGLAAVVLDLPLDRWARTRPALIGSESALIAALFVILVLQVPSSIRLDDYTTPALRDITEQLLDACDALPDPAIVGVDERIAWTDAIAMLAAMSRCGDVRANGHIGFIAGRTYELADGDWPNVVIEPAGQDQVAGKVAARNYAFEVLTAPLRAAR